MKESILKKKKQVQPVNEYSYETDDENEIVEEVVEVPIKQKKKLVPSKIKKIAEPEPEPEAEPEPVAPKKKTLSTAKQATLEKARQARKNKADERKSEREQHQTLVQAKERLKMEKQVMRKVRAQLKKEQMDDERQRVINEINELSDDEPIVPRRIKQPKVMNAGEYMRTLGF